MKESSLQITTLFGQIAILRHCIGEDTVEILDQFAFTVDEDENRLPYVLRKFDEYFNPRQNVLSEWYVFWSLTQVENDLSTCLCSDSGHKLPCVSLVISSR